MFARRYLQALNSSILPDDEQHHKTVVLAAPAHADVTSSGSVFGSLLSQNLTFA